jgi:hypothetical protein
MWRSQKSVIVTLLCVAVLVASLAGAGCAPTGDGGEGQWETPNSTGNGGEGPPGMPSGEGPPGMPWGDGEPGMPNDVLARVAEILGIDQQTLEDAFAQAQTEVGEATPGGGFSEAVMTRTAEILEIEEQDLQDAFAQALSEMEDEAPSQRPPDGNWTPRGPNEE